MLVMHDGISHIFHWLVLAADDHGWLSRHMSSISPKKLSGNVFIGKQTAPLTMMPIDMPSAHCIFTTGASSLSLSIQRTQFDSIPIFLENLKLDNRAALFVEGVFAGMCMQLRFLDAAAASRFVMS